MQRSISAIVLLTFFLFGALASNASAYPNPTAAVNNEGTKAAPVVLTGKVLSDGAAVSGAILKAGTESTTSDSNGGFRLELPTGGYKLQISANGHAPLSLQLSLTADTELTIELNPSSTLTVVADETSADPSAQVNAANDLIAAGPGLPGVPFSLPGFPSETASGGVKAPQYFAPGVAGDHGEPIAQYIRVGDFLFPNNLPANAHGNGYADPNLLIASGIGNVETDAGAFDVRHGNHAVNLAVAYGVRPTLEPVLQFTSDGRNYDLVSGWNLGDNAWASLEVGGGKGFLALPENRKQYKLNAHRILRLNRHHLTLFLASYYGSSRIPGLAPVGVRVFQDTIDPRQSDRTHTELLVANDTWQISENRQAQFSAFFRTYGLSLKSNFGEGLIRQSEFRTVIGGNASYSQRVNGSLSWGAGLDTRRDAPRDAELARLDSNGIFQPVTLSNFTIGSASPYALLNGKLSRFFSYNVGIRRDEIFFNNDDRLAPTNSDQTISGVTSPRGTISFHVPDRSALPVHSFSYGEGFHTNDPRIGILGERGTPVATSRAFQLVATEFAGQTQLRVVLSHVSNSQELAKIDPDTGLQENVGPSLVRSVSASVRRDFSFASLQATLARATATSTVTGEDIPEAPRLIWGISAARIRLPGRLRASAEFEYIGHKPLGDGFTALPLRDMRGSVSRSFRNDLFDASANFLLAKGFSGQTLETLQLQNESEPAERIVGVRKTSYAGITFTYHPRSRGR